MKKTILLFAVLTIFTINSKEQTVTDIDGNVYNTITIGTQTWMKENLKTSKYNDNTAIAKITDNTAWSITNIGAYCWYNNDSVSYENTYGKLYNWYTVNSNKLCPVDWHVPLDTEWTTFTDYLTNNGYGYQGSGSDIAKSIASTTGWATYTTAGTVGNNVANNNSSGFTGYPTGYRIKTGPFGYLYYDAAWWSTGSMYRHIRYNNTDITSEYYDPRLGFSVRCIKDEITNVGDINSKEGIRVFPNPATDRVFIYNIEKQEINMQIYNVIGECVLQGKLSKGINNVDINSLSKGIYIIKIPLPDRVIQHKLIKD